MLPGVDCRRLVFVDGAFAPELSDLAPEAGLTIGSMAEALAKGDALVAAHVGKTFETDDAAVALNTALMGDGAVIRVAAGADAQAADPSGLRRRQRQAELGLHAFAGRGRARAPRRP